MGLYHFGIIQGIIMNEQLNHAYDLIKQGQVQEAIDIIEPIIRNDRDNEDAWWLLANATEDVDAKRNALNNVLRITENDSRKDKAETLLRQLDDPFDFDISTTNKVGMSEYVAVDEVPKKSSGRFNCATISLIIVGIIGACGLFGCFAIYSASGNLMESASYPQNFDDMGILTGDDEVVGELSVEESRDVYHYDGLEGDMITISVSSNGTMTPFITLFDNQSQQLLAFSQPNSLEPTSISFTLPESSEYIIVINGIEFFGEEFGFGEYTLEFEVR